MLLINMIANLIDRLEIEFSEVDKVLRISKEKMMQEIDLYGISVEISDLNTYRENHDSHDSLLFVTPFCKGDETSNADLGALDLGIKIRDFLHGLDLSTESINSVLCRFESAENAPTYYAEYQAYGWVLQFRIRWVDIDGV